MDELMKIYNNFKMSMVGSLNVGLVALDEAINKIITENQLKDQRIKELESKVAELEKNK